MSYRIISKPGYNGCIPITIYWVQVKKEGMLSDKWENIKGFYVYERAVALMNFLNN